MSTKSLADRLAIRPDQSVCPINAMPDYAELVGRLPPGARIAAAGDRPADVVHLFVSSNAELEELLPQAIAAMRPGGSLWISYPKVSTGTSDLSRQSVHKQIRRSGWKPISQIAVDDVWSAIRARPV